MWNGGWRMEAGGWKMEDGGLRIEDGGWRLGDRRSAPAMIMTVTV
jgi:hypothetical protein